MLGPQVASVYIQHGQGNDDLKMDTKTSHVNSIEEATALSSVLCHDGEFGERFMTYTMYESASKPVVAFTADEIASKRGRLELELEFAPQVVGESGQKHYITIEDYLGNDALIQTIVTEIKTLPAGVWAGINKQVENVNVTFTAKKGVN